MASSVSSEQQTADSVPWFLKSSFPVYLPPYAELSARQSDFEEFLRTVQPSDSTVDEDKEWKDGLVDEEHQAKDTQTQTIQGESSKMEIDEANRATSTNSTTGGLFMKGLVAYGDELPLQDAKMGNQAETRTNLMRTENLDVAYRSTTNPLVDLFTELEEVVSGPRLLELLEGAWEADAVMTLKIIFNARSIHLGKGSRQTFYRCMGWLAKKHPQTLLVNLVWLTRPVIEKKAEKEEKKKKTNDDDDFEMVSVKAGQETDDENDENPDPASFDVKNGVAHGYWKDLLNTLVLYVNGKLDVLSNPRDVLNIEQDKKRTKWPKTQQEAKGFRVEKRFARHEAAVQLLRDDPVYRALHMTVARLFAARLQHDLALLRGHDAAAKRTISLCAKWAPSSEHFHDKHTFIVSSIAEILHPVSELEGVNVAGQDAREQREHYLRHAREAYRKDMSALRKHLEIVERDLSAKTFHEIKYDRVPSAAMNNYASLFAEKDMDRFEKYIDNVASGKSRISGATLLPSLFVKAYREKTHIPICPPRGANSPAAKKGAAKALVRAKVAALRQKTEAGQWNALVQRIRDAGTLSHAIAVADVSGSMLWSCFPDGTCPLDSSVGLALLVAEVTPPPFGGAFITFAEQPTVQRLDHAGWSLHDKLSQLFRAPWGGSTDFVAVFEKLILPMAIEHGIPQADMVKRVFVFSDMHFNTATRGQESLGSSYERIQHRFREAGYEMPELVFWNLAGGRAGYPALGGMGCGEQEAVAPKPVTAEERGTALVSGYSQGMLKVFMEGGPVDEFEDDEEIVQTVVVGEEEEVVVDKVKKQKMDPLSVVTKAVGHRAYRMLRVVD